MTAPDDDRGGEPSSGGPSSEEDDESFDSFLKSFSREWLNTQLTHQVSLAACNAFWKIAFRGIPSILEMKKIEKINKAIPQYPQIKKNIYNDLCPDIKMHFVYENTSDGSIIHVNTGTTPITKYQRDPMYKKLYEEAHIEVIIVRSIANPKCIFTQAELIE